MVRRFHTGPTKGDPVYDELVRTLEEDPVPNTAIGPRLTGTTTAGGSNTIERKKTDFRNPMQARGDMIYGGKGGAPLRVSVGSPGQVPRLQEDGITVAFSDAPAGSGTGARYRHLVLTDDGAGGWGFVVSTIDGQTWPVTALADLEE